MSNRIYTIIVAILCMLLFSGCLLKSWFPYSEAIYTPKFSKGEDFLKLSSDYNPDPENRLNINGYYFPYVDSTKLVTSFYGPRMGGYVFRPDGSVDEVLCDLPSYHINIDSIDFESLYRNGNVKIKRFIGVYKVENDELTIDKVCLTNLTLVNTWYLDVKSLKIINDTTLYYYKCYDADIGKYFYSGKCYYRFFPAIDSLKVTYNRDKTKERKWMWANKKDLKEYKRKVKAYEDSVKRVKK